MILDETSLETFQKRIEKIREDSVPQWGKLKPIDLMAHLRRFCEISLGQVTVKNYSIPLFASVLYILFFKLFTRWPQSKLKRIANFFPETKKSDFASEQRMLMDSLNLFVSTAAQHPERKALHPIFGYIGLEKWQVIHGVHLNHHLRQFGV